MLALKLLVMKNWNNQDFAGRSPILLSLHEADQLVVPNNLDQFSWLNSLPIAAGIFHLNNNVITQAANNSAFEYLTLGSHRELGLDIAWFADRIIAMSEQNRESLFECWTSPDPVSKRELEINIARFGANNEWYLLSLVDRTAEVASRVNLRREMLSDSLTGFCNRTGFEEEVENRLTVLNAQDAASKVIHQYAIILIDMARFSRVNESVGAMVGDELIITIASRLKSRIRGDELLCRLGGNEFALFAQLDDPKSGLSSIAARITSAFEDPCKLSGLEIQVECAVSGAIGSVAADDPNDILRYAHIALKRAKASKKFELYTPENGDSVQHRFSIETDLRRALQRGELQLHYQPLVDLDTGQLNGFEALARWEHPDHGFISPVDFIPVAEESGLIVPLGRWALEAAAQTIKAWDIRSNKELPFKISVNLSTVQLLRDDVVEAVSSALNGAGIDGDRLTLELTESAFISDPDGTKRILNALKGLNTNLAMDDFGTGYSNLAYLQQLPIDVLKIDRSFVSDMTTNNDKRAIVKTVLSLAQALGMKTTAEGIETIEISAALRHLGCSFGQGYYFARPLTAEAAYAFLVSNNAPATN